VCGHPPDSQRPPHTCHALTIPHSSNHGKWEATLADAEDAVRETYLRFARADLDTIREPRGWLTTVIGRICLDHLSSARVRREQYVGPWLPEPLVGSDAGLGMAPLTPEDRVTLDESVSMAMLVVLESLSPPERTAFVLHDVFSLSYEEVAATVGRSEAACRQLISRARGRVRERAPRFTVDAKQQNAVVEAFLNACADGGVDTLVNVLAPEVARGGTALGRWWPGQRGRPTASRRRRERGAVAARRGRQAPCVPLDATGQQRYRPGFRRF
jgi:RNA polymerase sigma-70 factor (ECF subfamily)